MPEWFLPIVFSALTLGIYDVCKKHAVRDNAVMPVLLLSCCFGAVLFVALSAGTGQLLPALRCTGCQFLLVLLKSLLVSASWICGFYAVRELPVSLAAPIRSSAPLWTLLGGVLLYHEIPTLRQGIGMAVILTGYAVFSVLGKKEGFPWKSRGMVLIAAGTILGACSALYDKFLLNVCLVPRNMLQLYFSLDLAGILFLAWLFRRSFFARGCAFHWRWSVPVTGIMLIVADYSYFYALSTPVAAISILSLIRRCSCIVTFCVGAVCFREVNLKRKAAALALLLLGVLLLAR